MALADYTPRKWNMFHPKLKTPQKKIPEKFHASGPTEGCRGKESF